MTDITTIADTYIAMWNETDRPARADLIATAWAPDGAYTDPLQEALGHDALSAMVDAIHEQYPGHRFRRTTAVDSHHDHHRFVWELGDGETVLVAGLDVASTGVDGRLTRITGFFGPIPDEAVA